MSYDAEVRVEDLIGGWTAEEIAALLAGDQEAREELIGQACYRAFDGSEVEPDHAEIVIDGKLL